MCLGCGINIADINVKDRKVLVKYTELIPLWEEILRIKLYELHPDATLSEPILQTKLGSPKDANHGLLCKKCHNSYTRYYKNRLPLSENMMKVLGEGALSEAIEDMSDNSAAEPTTSAGKKRSRPYSLPSSKRLCLMSKFNDSDTTMSDSQSASPPAVVS